MAESKRHIDLCGCGTLCGSSRVTTWINRSDCANCNRRMDVIIDILNDCADAVPGAAERAATMIRKLGVTSEDVGPGEPASVADLEV